MKKYIAVMLAALLLLGSQIACDKPPPQVPDIKVPTLEVGEMQDQREAIPLEDDEPVAVEIAFGAGDLEIETGVSDQLFSGHFRYNVERWAPE
ncbi:MAG: toast rack family protein, partial [Chloroflexota bacterium]|nr:toast rack family protein [Chloroflexota bacterium]